jgi:hypothetical protein
MKFVQISDIHFVAPGERLYGLDPRERLEHCIEDIDSRLVGVAVGSPSAPAGLFDARGRLPASAVAPAGGELPLKEDA